jgi:hypothetical protein
MICIGREPSDEIRLMLEPVISTRPNDCAVGGVCAMPTRWVLKPNRARLRVNFFMFKVKLLRLLVESRNSGGTGATYPRGRANMVMAYLLHIESEAICKP